MTSKKSKDGFHSSKPQSSGPTLSRHQAFEAVTISRQQIKNADYNPRSIDKYARSKLKESLKKAGLVETLVWNKRTGNLVGGHQRISVLDELEKHGDYLLTVAQIDVDEKREKELNISLNNTSMQGMYDQELLERLVRESEEALDSAVLGFDGVELNNLLGVESFGGFDNAAATKEKETLEKIAGAKQRSREKEAVDNDANHYLVVVFESTSDMDKFREEYGLPPGEQYLDAKHFRECVR